MSRGWREACGPDAVDAVRDGRVTRLQRVEFAPAPVLLVAFGCVFTWSAIAPTYRQDWLLENVLVFAALVALVATRQRLPLSKASYAQVFLFLALHEVGAHYTYSLVPYDAWFARLGGGPSAWFGLERNHYDRLIHFCYGLLMLQPSTELLRSATRASRAWLGLLAWTFVLSHSVVYELIEWAAAVVFGGDLGIAYLGTQGDVWDAQKDMACAATGALLATLLSSRRTAVGRVS